MCSTLKVYLRHGSLTSTGPAILLYRYMVQIHSWVSWRPTYNFSPTFIKLLSAIKQTTARLRRIYTGPNWGLWFNRYRFKIVWRSFSQQAPFYPIASALSRRRHHKHTRVFIGAECTIILYYILLAVKADFLSVCCYRGMASYNNW